MRERESIAFSIYIRHSLSGRPRGNEITARRTPKRRKLRQGIHVLFIDWLCVRDRSIERSMCGVKYGGKSTSKLTTQRLRFRNNFLIINRAKSGNQEPNRGKEQCKRETPILIGNYGVAIIHKRGKSKRSRYSVAIFGGE